MQINSPPSPVYDSPLLFMGMHPAIYGIFATQVDAINKYTGN